METFATTISIIVPTDTNGSDTELSPKQVVAHIARVLQGVTITRGIGYWQGTYEIVYVLEQWSNDPQHIALLRSATIAKWIGRVLCKYAVSFKVNGKPYIINIS